MTPEEKRAYNAAYYQRNIEKARKTSREWRENNLEQSRATSKAWHSVHPSNNIAWRSENWAKILLSNAVLASRRRKHTKPTITEEWILSQTLTCPYLGIELVPRSLDSGLRRPNAPSLDRIDNSKGYDHENIRLTSWFWNSMRGTMSPEDTLGWLGKIKL